MTNQFQNLQRSVGRPKKQIKINRRISVNFNDYKSAITLMRSGYSMTKVTNLLDGALTMNEVIAIRSYAVKNAILPMKRSTLKGHQNRVKQVKTMPMVTENKVTEKDLFSGNQEIDKPVKVETKVVTQVFTPVFAGKTLAIDFKGIMMHVQINSIEVKDNLIIVR